MPFTPKFVDLVRNFTTVQGTGPVTLGAAVSGYTGLAGAVATGDQFYYCIQGVDRPQEREVGRGTLLSDGRVAREPIAGGLTSFTSGTKTIALVAAAEWFSKLELGGAGGAAIDVATTAALAARAVPTSAPALLVQAGREGLFKFVASDLTAAVAADPNQGVYIAPASDPDGSSGAWVRHFSGPFDARWFGMSTGNTGAQNSAALQALCDFLEATGTAQSGTGVPYRGGGHVSIPRGIYLMAGAVDVRASIHFEGESAAVHGGAAATVLRWNNSSSGFRVQRVNTSGDGTFDAASHGGGDGSTFSNLALEGGTAATYVAGTESGDHHGIHFKARIQAYNVQCKSWSGNGFHSNATAGAAGSGEGNANYWKLMDCMAIDCRNGLCLDGADTNAGFSLGFNASSCRQWGIFDGSFLSNHHFGFHLDGNGFCEQSMSTLSGNVYSVIPGQEDWCSTNGPSGTSASNQGWLYHAPGGVGAFGARNWAPGLTWRAGGPLSTDNANAHHVLSGYVEGGQAPAMLAEPTLVVGGQLGSAKRWGTTENYSSYLLAIPRGLRVPGQLLVDGLLDLAGGVSFRGSGSWASGHRLFMDDDNGLNLFGDAGSANDFLFGNSAGTTWLTLPTGSINPNFAGSINIGPGKTYKVGGVQVVGAQQAAIADAGAGQEIEKINAMLGALRAHGLIAA